MPYLLDTNVAVHLAEGNAAIEDKVVALDDVILLSIVTRIELEGGVYRDPAQAMVRRPRLDAVLSAIPTIAFDDVSADIYRTIVERSGYSRRKLLDRMIAAQALSARATLVTMNAADFSDIPGLGLLSW